jgi:hypothetical protein
METTSLISAYKALALRSQGAQLIMNGFETSGITVLNNYFAFLSSNFEQVISNITNKLGGKVQCKHHMNA